MWPFRRRVADSTPISDSLWQSACARAEVLSALSSAQARKLRQLAAEFLARKHITTVHGLELAPSDRALIACLCCLPVLNLGGHWLGGWREVVVYPGAFRVRRQELEESSGVLHEWDEELAGEAWSEGPLILSWQDLLDDLAEPDSGCNVIAHEIAHKLDLRDGVLDGTPPLAPAALQEWVRDFTAAFEALNATLDQDGEPSIDPYAASSPEEFFAVVTEYHFAAPAVLATEMPAVAARLREFYGSPPLLRD